MSEIVTISEPRPGQCEAYCRADHGTRFRCERDAVKAGLCRRHYRRRVRDRQAEDTRRRVTREAVERSNRRRRRKKARKRRRSR